MPLAVKLNGNDDPSQGGRFIMKKTKQSKSRSAAAAPTEPAYDMMDVDLALVGIKLSDEGFVQQQVRVTALACVGST